MCALLLALLLAPGDLIELRGTALYELGGALGQTDAICRFAIASPVYSQAVYIPRATPTAAGVTRVWWQRVGVGYIQLRGVQLSDGRVLTESGAIVDLDSLGGAY